MSIISALCRQQVYARLNASFNTTLATVAPTYGVQPFVIDFATVPNSINFFYGKLRREDIERSGVQKGSIIALYTEKSANRNLQKATLFAGPVLVGIDIHMSFRGGKANQDFEAMPDALEDVMLQVMNARNTQNWGMAVVYNGQIGMDRGPVEFGAENWKKTLQFTMQFDVVTQ